MFPIPWNKAFRKKDGTLVNMEDMGGGGGGGSFTPDYDNNILIIGTHEDYEYYVPMSRRYIGDAISGYAIKTNPSSSMQSAKIDLYSLIYVKETGEIIDSTLLKTLSHNGDHTYSDEFISITYLESSGKWSVTMLQTMYNTSGDEYTSPLEWAYSTQVDYTLLTTDPTQE